MGNKQSKIAAQERVEAAEKKSALAAETVAAREDQLARKETELEASRVQGENAGKDAESLRQKLKQVGTEAAALEQVRAEQNGKLQTDLNKKVNECVGQRRLVESLTQERDGARRRLDELDGKINAAEQNSQTLLEESQLQRGRFEEAAGLKAKELQMAKDESSQLQTRVQTLEEANSMLTEEASRVKTAVADETQRCMTAEEESASTKKQLASSKSNLSSLQQEHQALNEKWLAVEATAAEEMQKRMAVERELHSTKNQLAFSDEKRDSLQRTHNEVVSKKAAAHETLEATRLQLRESYEQYQALHEVHEKLRKASEEKEASDSKGGGKVLQQAHDKLAEELDGVRKELSERRHKRADSQAALDKLSTEVMVKEVNGEVSS